MFAKQYDVALGCSCFKPLLISIWNFRPFRLTDLQRPSQHPPHPPVAEQGYDGGSEEVHHQLRHSAGQ